jgi:hypothetical protein
MISDKAVLKYVNKITAVVVFTIFFIGCGGKVSSDISNISSNITGTVAKGKVLEGKVVAYKDDGTIIGEDTDISDSKYSIPRNGYIGKVKIEAFIERYTDEKTDKNVTVKVLKLSAISHISSNDTTVNITPVTDIAYKLLGGKDLKLSSTDTNDIINTNKKIARDLGVGDIDPTKQDIKILNNGDNNQTNTDDTRYGAVLAAISADSNITSKIDGVVNARKVTNTIDKLLQLIKKGNSQAISDIIKKGLENANVSLKDENRTLIAISNDNNVSSISSTISDITNASRNEIKDASGNITIKDVTGKVYLNIDNGLASLDGASYKKSLLLPEGNSTIKVKGIAPATLSTTRKVILYILDKNVSFNITTKDANTSKIQQFADTNGTDPTSLSVDDFYDAGVKKGSVTNSNVDKISNFIKSANKEDVNTTLKIQAIVDISNYVDKKALVDNEDVPTIQTYTTLGFINDINFCNFRES